MKRIMLLGIVLMLSLSIWAQDLHIYGGKSHNVYLGCMTGSDYDSNSIWNEYGKYGNSYNTNCIWNEYSDYGSEYGDYSPWNAYAKYPPAVVDKQGRFYGYLTIDKYNSKRADLPLALYLYKYFEFIREDIGTWYKKIFEEE